MQLPTQQQFVDNCLAKYWFTDIPADQQWEEAHFPLPSCSGEDDTVLLWSADHTVQGLLQSVEFDHPCFHFKANGKDLYNLETYYPDYLELFKQLKSHFNSRNGKKGGKKGGKKCAELKRGCHAPGMASAGGKIVGANNAKNKTGFCGRSAEQMSADGKKGSKIGKKIGGKITGAQRWQCLVTDYISNPCGLSHYQRKRGIDTKLRVKIN